MQRTVSELSQKLETMGEQLMALHQENEVLNEESKDLQSKLSDLHDERRCIQEDKSSTQQRLLALQQEMKEQEQNLLNKDSYVLQLQEQVKFLQTEKASLKRNLRDSGRRIASLTTDLSANKQVCNLSLHRIRQFLILSIARSSKICRMPN